MILSRITWGRTVAFIRQRSSAILGPIQSVVSGRITIVILKVSHIHIWTGPLHTLETRNVTGCAIHCERIIVARSNDKRTLLGGRVFSFNRDWEIVELRRVYLSVREHHKLQLIKNVQNVELIRGLSSKSSSSSVALPEHRLWLTVTDWHGRTETRKFFSAVRVWNWKQIGKYSEWWIRGDFLLKSPETLLQVFSACLAMGNCICVLYWSSTKKKKLIFSSCNYKFRTNPKTKSPARSVQTFRSVPGRSLFIDHDHPHSLQVKFPIIRRLNNRQIKIIAKLNSTLMWCTSDLINSVNRFSNAVNIYGKSSFKRMKCLVYYFGSFEPGPS